MGGLLLLQVDAVEILIGCAAQIVDQALVALVERRGDRQVPRPRRSA
jgi:hypothetical protein